MLDGCPYAPPTLAEADRDFREFEKGFTSREEAVCLLDAKSDAFVVWLDGLAPEKLGTLVTTPFGMDPMPIEVVITFPAFHKEHARRPLPSGGGGMASSLPKAPLLFLCVTVNA